MLSPLILRCAAAFSCLGSLVVGASPGLSLSLERTVPGGLLISWPTVAGRPYELLATTDLAAGWGPRALAGLPQIATTAALAIELVHTGPAQFFQLRENPSPYDPPWENVPSLRDIPFTYNGGLTAQENGANLKVAMQSLVAGDRLVIGAGTYSINSFTTLNLTGTASAPIWIEAAPGATVILTRPDASQNLINVGSGGPARYVCFRGLEFVGGSHGVRLYDCANVWIDRCRIRDTGDVGLSANARDTSRLYITSNEIWNTGGTGEGMYLGGNNGSVIMSESIIALNHVHDTDNGVSQGDGIEVKQGSWGNLIAANLVHDCNYPCILVYGTAGMPRNIVEHNICFRSNDNAMQIQGECLVRNNLVIGAAGSAFASQPHQGDPTQITVVHNTFINTGNAARLSAWDAGTEMIFANNACYSQNGAAVNAVNSVAGVTFAGNVLFGSVASGITGYLTGSGLGDFRAVTWDGVELDARPLPGSPLVGSAAAPYATEIDLFYFTRPTPPDAGCLAAISGGTAAGEILIEIDRRVHMPATPPPPPSPTPGSP